MKITKMRFTDELDREQLRKDLRKLLQTVAHRSLSLVDPEALKDFIKTGKRDSDKFETEDGSHVISALDVCLYATQIGHIVLEIESKYCDDTNETD